MFGKKQAKLPAVETVETSSQDARAKVSALRARLRELENERARLNSARWAIETANDGGKLDDAAAALLEDVAAEIPDVTNIEQNLKKVENDIVVTEKALFKAREILDAAKRRDARAAVKQLRPAHREAVAKIAHALALLEDANREEAAIRGQIPGGGPTLPLASFPGVGGRNIQCSPAFYWFRFAKDSGLLDERPLYADAAD
ncbi:MAG: hypothetical protein RIA64_01790 [Rhodospirillales bacterium]